MSTIIRQIIELVKSLPAEDQPAIRSRPQRRQLPRLADGSYFNPAGISNDDPIFKSSNKLRTNDTANPARRRLRLIEPW